MTLPNLPLSLADVYLAGWELRLNDLPIEEYLMDLGGGPVATVARRPLEMQIARGDTVAVSFKLVDDEYDGDGICEFVAAVQEARGRAGR